MAENANIGGGGSLFVGEDKTLHLELVLQSDQTTAVNLADYATIFDVRLSDTAADPIVSLTPTLTGVFNAVRALNTQRAVVTVTSADMNLFRAKNYRWSWKRTDNGSETVLAYGNFSPQKATAP